METVFDHAITPSEYLAIGVPDIEKLASDVDYKHQLARKGIGAESNKAFLNSLDAVSNAVFIAHLYAFRGNMAKAKEYAEKLPNDMRLDFYRTVYHSSYNTVMN
ncbi:MAG: hypothetical protein AB7C90_02355 [Bacteroidales bacterium]